jgi:hypothetical protein
MSANGADHVDKGREGDRRDEHREREHNDDDRYRRLIDRAPRRPLGRKIDSVKHGSPCETRLYGCPDHKCAVRASPQDIRPSARGTTAGGRPGSWLSLRQCVAQCPHLSVERRQLRARHPRARNQGFGQATAIFPRSRRVHRVCMQSVLRSVKFSCTSPFPHMDEASPMEDPRDT